MDRRSWPWKKRSSEKAVTTVDSVTASLANSSNNQADQDSNKVPSYVKVSEESYAHLTGLEAQVKDLQEKLISANENLSSAQAEIIARDVLVKQHAKVAEEAVSGWEKAEAEAAALKQQLESATLLRLTVEERASHLDGALKECMKQIRNVKEECEQKLQDIIFAKTKQLEKVEAEFEVKIANIEQELLRASGENVALSRSLQERSIMLMKISEEKSQADSEIEMLKDTIQSCVKEINSMKYEFHIVSKELEIRNEEKNMSARSAEVSNKQHLEDVKKIAKLEAECQRLRGLVRKKLPGPAALAQMKVEVDNLGRDYGDTRLRRSARGSSPGYPQVPKFSLENIQQCQKESEFLTARLLAMEEEMKMLKEALSNRNGELQASRHMCAKTINKLQSIETRIIPFNQQRSPSRPNIDIHFENRSNPPSLTSMSEDGIDDAGSCSESWATAVISELQHFKKDQDFEKDNKTDHLLCMDDFLEMERLASLSEVNGPMSISDAGIENVKSENDDCASAANVPKDGSGKEEQAYIKPEIEKAFTSDRNDGPLSKLQSRITSIFECKNQILDMPKILEDIRCILQDVQADLTQDAAESSFEETQVRAAAEKNHNDENMEEVSSCELLLNNSSLCTDKNYALDQELQNAISQINDFVEFIVKEALKVQCTSSGLTEKFKEFTSSVGKVLSNELGLSDLIFSLSHVLTGATELTLNILGDSQTERNSNSSECIDKATLRLSGTCLLACSSFDVEIERTVDPGSEPEDTLQKELERLKMEKESIQMDLDEYARMLEQMNLQAVKMEQHIVELKLQLAASEKSNSSAETQLKCMAESHKSLEWRTKELEAEIHLLQVKTQTLDDELQDEKHRNQDSLTKCRELQEQIERSSKSHVHATLSDIDGDNKRKQEKEIAAAEKKLTECQETILLLGKQLKAFCPPADLPVSSIDDTQRMNDAILEDPRQSGYTLHGMPNLDQVEMESANVFTQTTGSEPPLDGYNSQMSPLNVFPRSPMSSKRQKQRSSGFLSSPSISDKHGRGFSRFFSKGK